MNKMSFKKEYEMICCVLQFLNYLYLPTFLPIRDYHNISEQIHHIDNIFEMLYLTKYY